MSEVGVEPPDVQGGVYGNGYIDVAAPGGDAYDTPTGDRDLAQTVLAAYPKLLAIANGEIDENGEPTVPYVVKSCDAAGTCAYYQYLQGTSMASPHAAGVAALIVGRWSFGDRNGGTWLFPDATGWLLSVSANATPCPSPPTVPTPVGFPRRTAPSRSARAPRRARATGGATASTATA